MRTRSGVGKLHTGSKAWRAVRQRVLERDQGLCIIRGPGCTVIATQVDHIVPVKAGGALYDEANCRASCEHCNKAREDQSRKRRRRRPSQEWPRAKVPHSAYSPGRAPWDPGIA